MKGQETSAKIVADAGPSKRVLIVDREGGFGLVMGYFLERRGFATHVAGDARTAWQDAATFRPTAIVLDLEEDDPDGLDLLAALAGDDERPRVLVYTFHASVLQMPADVRARLGIDDVLPRPSRLDLMVQRLAALDGTKGPELAAATALPMPALAAKGVRP